MTTEPSSGPPARPTRAGVAMVGFQGFGNVGDEAILCGIESLLGDRVDVEAIFSGGRQRIAAFPSAARIRTWHHLPTITAWRVLRRSRALAISGGGLINDHWATVIPRYVGWCLAARLAGCRVVWVGSGVGPIRRTVWRIVAGLGFRASRLVTVRDAASADWVRRCAPGTRVAQIPDPAFFMDRPAPASAARPSGQVSGRLAIVARGPIRDDEDASLRLAEALADVVVGRADAGNPRDGTDKSSAKGPLKWVWGIRSPLRSQHVSASSVGPFLSALAVWAVDRSHQRPYLLNVPVSPITCVAKGRCPTPRPKYDYRWSDRCP